ncbi:hypothetical protein K1X76_07895 [bacterium]|nr:hypothetical protein [bacterium]
MRFSFLILAFLCTLACSGSQNLTSSDIPNDNGHYTIATNPTKPAITKNFSIAGKYNYQAAEPGTIPSTTVSTDLLALSVNPMPTKVAYKPIQDRCNPENPISLVAMAPNNIRTTFDIKANEEFSVSLPEGPYELYFFQNYGETNQVFCSSLMYSDTNTGSKLGGLYAGIILKDDLELGDLTEYASGFHLSDTLAEIQGAVDLNDNGHLDEYIENLNTTLLPDLNILNMNPYNSGIVPLWGSNNNTGFIYMRVDDIVKEVDGSQIKITAQNDENTFIVDGVTSSNITIETDTSYQESIIRIKLQNALEPRGKYTLMIGQNTITTESARVLPHSIVVNFTAKRRLNQENHLKYYDELMEKFTQ